MRRVLIAAIAAYQTLVPSRLKPTCIFDQSCSRRVRAVTAAEGLGAGLAELWRRTRQCRPGYRPLDIHSPAGVRLFVLADGSVVEASQLSAAVLRQHPDPSATAQA